METKKDISYGVVSLYKDSEGWCVLLVHQISYRGDDFWIFPKGHAEAGESPKEAALRELEEETGITQITVKDTPPIIVAYSFIHEGIRIEKTVEYFVGLCHNQATFISQPHEIKELCWCSFEEAANRLTHQNSRDVLDKVKVLL